MSRSSLSAEYTHLGYVIAWVTDGESGLRLGDLGNVPDPPDPAKYTSYQRFIEDWEVHIAEVVAHDRTALHSSRSDGTGCYVYESESAAKKVISAINRTLKIRPTEEDWESSKPHPSWASEALALGWTPPAKKPGKKPAKKKRS